ncbi:MAG: hypothetical protein IT547_10010 [Hyphomonadaceae bacterium]|jgi:hypothetical protein|nr:hypothetical protein [Hyphomonadaceae bacterium]
MTRIELAIKALEELPEHRREEIADVILDVIATYGDDSALTEEQWAEVRRRQVRGFKQGDPKRIDQLLERLKQA